MLGQGDHTNWPYSCVFVVGLSLIFVFLLGSHWGDIYLQPARFSANRRYFYNSLRFLGYCYNMSSRFSARYLRSKHSRSAVAAVTEDAPLADQLDEVANLASGLGSGSLRESDESTLTVGEQQGENEQPDGPNGDQPTGAQDIEEESNVVDDSSVARLSNSISEEDQAMITGMVNVEGDISIGVPYSEDYPGLETAPSQVNEPAVPFVDVPATTSTNYFKLIQRAIRCYFSDPGVQDGDREPLLPIHGRPSDNPTEAARPDYSNCIVDFIWDYVLTESMRRFFTTHQNLVIFLVILTIVIVLVITYFTGTFPYLVLYFRIIICWLASIFYEDSPTFRAVCGR